MSTPSSYYPQLIQLKVMIRSCEVEIHFTTYSAVQADTATLLCMLLVFLIKTRTSNVLTT